MKKFLISCFILVLLVMGCNKESLPLQQSPFLKTTWVLSYIQDAKTNAITNYPSDAAKKISIVFSDSSNIFFSLAEFAMAAEVQFPGYFPRTNTI